MNDCQDFRAAMVWPVIAHKVKNAATNIIRNNTEYSWSGSQFLEVLYTGTSLFLTTEVLKEN